MDVSRRRLGLRLVAVILGALVSVAYTGASVAQTITVRSEPELQNAVASANNSGGNVTILVADGTYTLSDTLYVNAPGIRIIGESQDRTRVTIQGDAMSSSARVGNLIRVAGSNFELAHVTLRRSGWHLVQIAGEDNADSPTIRDCVLQDAYEQLVKVSVNEANLNVASDNGTVENCIFEYTAGIGPQYYIGGLDAHAATNWTVRGNTFRNIISPNTAVAEYAVHFWNQSADNLVEKNLIVNCDRGIGFGLGDRGNSRGTIRNNMIYHADNRGQFADVGIALQNSSGSQVYNNTIYMEHGYPSAIEYRFAGSSGVDIRNNLVNRQISRLDGASGTTTSNITNAAASWFVNVGAGDLHLANGSVAPVDSGAAIGSVVDDFDGDIRPAGGAFDVGADEFGTRIAPNPPTNLRVE